MSIVEGDISSNFRFNNVLGTLNPVEITGELQTVIEFPELPTYYGFNLRETPQTDVAGITQVKRTSDNQIFTHTSTSPIGATEYFFDYSNDMPTIYFNSANDTEEFEIKYFGVGGVASAGNISELVATEVSNILPVGTILPYSGISTPSDFLLTDGSAISRSTYSTLFAAITSAKGAFTVTIATPALVTLNGHGLITGDCISFTTTGALPTGLSINTNYYVIYVNANTFNLATSYANALVPTAINTTGSQSGVHSLLFNPYGISGASNFLLPDSRAAFLRGSGTSTLFTANVTTGQGHYADDKSQGHNHYVYRENATGGNSGIAGLNQFTSLSFDLTEVYGIASSPVSDGVNGTPRTATETAGKSLGVRYIIKY